MRFHTRNFLVYVTVLSFVCDTYCLRIVRKKITTTTSTTALPDVLKPEIVEFKPVPVEVKPEFSYESKELRKKYKEPETKYNGEFQVKYVEPKLKYVAPNPEYRYEGTESELKYKEPEVRYGESQVKYGSPLAKYKEPEVRYGESQVRYGSPPAKYNVQVPMDVFLPAEATSAAYKPLPVAYKSLPVHHGQYGHGGLLGQGQLPLVKGKYGDLDTANSLHFGHGGHGHFHHGGFHHGGFYPIFPAFNKYGYRNFGFHLGRLGFRYGRGYHRVAGPGFHKYHAGFHKTFFFG